MKKIRTNLLLIAILIMASVLRLWNLNNIPPHLTPDEAALGYNAYSILKTGRDEHGVILPIIFKSFGDYKPGFYVYATVPFVATLGLNEWSTRLPSALSGILIVYLIYLIIKKLEIGNSLKIGNCTLEIVAAFIAAINPWLIYFSRGAWEANLSLMLTLLGIYLFLKSLDNNKFLLFSAVAFALTLITYQGAKLSTFIVVALLVIINRKEFLQKYFGKDTSGKKYLIASGVIGFLISLPILFSFIGGQAGRLTVFSIFTNSRPDEYLNKMLVQNNETKGDINYYLFHSDTQDIVRGIMGRWFNHFSGRFLFFEGDWPNPRHSAPYQGMLLLTDMALLLAGLVSVLNSKIVNRKSLPAGKAGLIFVFLWLVLAPLPAVLTRDQVHAVRALNMAIPLVIICAFGVMQIAQWLNGFRFKWLKNFGLIFVIGIWGMAFIYFLDAYFIHVSKHSSKLWEYGYKQIVETVTPIQDNYKVIKIQQSFAQPYIYFLFHQKYDPAKYQKQVNFVESGFKGDVGYIEKLDNIQFVPIDWSINRGDHGALVVGDGVRIPMSDSNDAKEFNLIKDIYYLNNRDLAFRIVEVK